MKKTIVIAPFSKRLANGKKNPKNYAYWPKVIAHLKKKNHLIQIGLEHEEDLGCHEFLKGLHLSEIRKVIERCDTWVAVETFLMHMANLVNKRGVVIWHICNPKIYGYETNINLFRDRKYFRPNQFDMFENTPYNEAGHVNYAEVIKAVDSLLS